MFNIESDFEAALIKRLIDTCGWDKNVLKYLTEEDLIKNWQNILFENNRRRDCLNEVPLSDTEMAQIISQINAIRSPLKMNDFINGKSITIKRDNPADPEHLGKDVSLRIYDRMEIAAGTSKYQIAQQPIFKGKSQLGRDRRGDFMLLINGMPLIHVELKKSGVPISQAYNQIEKYTREGIFASGIFSMVQVFVAMNPEEAVYFANPGYDGKFNKDFYFHWADFNNEKLNKWEEIASRLLSIPMAHQLIGFYTVSDNTDGVLKVMRSYQYYASNAIAKRVAKRDWESRDITGGYIWHTTGSGKTLTSFKTAQLIAASNDADKVVFLMDRIELGTQSLLEYRGFAGEMIDVQSTEDTSELIARLKSDKTSDTLIVTSIQKMSKIQRGEGYDGDIDKIDSKRVVFIVDECHRSTFGDMMTTIKNTFPMSMLFGFTGTPIHEEIGKEGLGTADIFGNELHRYSIANGIEDKNVLGFDPYMVCTYNDKAVRTVVGLQEAKANDISEIFGDKKKEDIFYYYQNTCPMAGYIDDNGDRVRGVEDFIPRSQYDGNDTHHMQVIEDIKNNFLTLSRGHKFHAIFATSSIPEAIAYYRLLKANTDLRITAMFDENDPEDAEVAIDKSKALMEILDDYNKNFGQTFTLPTFAGFKKDVAYRLAHKNQYSKLEQSKQLDLLIVVNQMLTGFDSKWVNTLYLDKVIVYQNLIQAFSRTNRLFNENEKPFGIIRYYRYPHTMKSNVEKAFAMFSGNKPMGLFANKLPYNLQGVNDTYKAIFALFKNAGVADFAMLPASTEEKSKFAKLYRALCGFVNAAKLQGFIWEVSEYSYTADDGTTQKITVEMSENAFAVLTLRYKELFSPGGVTPPDDTPFDLDGSLTEVDTGKIDYDYMNTRFTKFVTVLDNGDPDEIERVKNELHSTFASLTSEEQKFANIFLVDIESGKAHIEEGKLFKDYINEYMQREKDDIIHQVAVALGVDEEQLREFKKVHITEADIDKFGKFTALKSSADITVAKGYFEKRDNCTYITPRVRQQLDASLRNFILYDIFQ